MKPHSHTITADALMAYVDGQLTAQRRAQVEAHLVAHPETAAHVAELRAQRHALHGHFDPVLHEPVPQRLLVVQRQADRAWLKVAAVGAWMALGLGVGSVGTWQYLARTETAPDNFAYLRGEVDLPRFVHQAKVAHTAYASDVRRPVEIYSTQQVQLVGWLSKRLGRQIKLPNLADAGFHLVGGRLLPGEVNKPAAQIMYENAAGQRLTIYLRGMAQPTPETALRFAEQDGIATFYWVDLDWGYALSGALPRASLLHLATSVYQQLNG
jgi:anti-sigma factor RsiW